jgi:hypothetical protein
VKDPTTVLLPGEREATREMATVVRAWWKARTLEAIDRSGVTLPQAWTDLQFFVCAYLIGRLNSPKTPVEIKDAIALRLAPQMGILLKGTPAGERPKELGNPMSEAHEMPKREKEPPAAPDGSVGSLLQSYGVSKLPQ